MPQWFKEAVAEAEPTNPGLLVDLIIQEIGVQHSSGVRNSQRVPLSAAAAVAAAVSPRPAVAENAIPSQFSFDVLSERMAALAHAPYISGVKGPNGYPSPDDYRSYRKIEARSGRAIPLGGLGYYLQPLAGGHFAEPVKLFEVTADAVDLLPEAAADFDYQDSAVAGGEGAAGVRLGHSMDHPGGLSEFASFFGASNFSGIGRGNAYGASARGAAINSWTERPEEYPRFTAFYFLAAEADEPLTVYASLEGPSLTGAFRFTLTPATDRQETVMDVTSRLFFRDYVAQLGVAPITSMYLYGAANRGQFDDYRLRVHDSDGLWIRSADNQLSWRALNNPSELANSYLGQPTPLAFGLMQRARGFNSYQDAEALFHLRPSVVVEPRGDRGTGFVRLIEIPTRSETEDNIVAFWMTDKPYEAGESAEFSYRLRWGDLVADGSVVAIVSETRTGRGGFSGVENSADLRKFVVDFKGAVLRTESLPSGPLDPLVVISGGRLTSSTLSRLPAPDMMRLVIDAEMSSTDPVELRALIVGGGRQLTETWLYQWRAAPLS